MIGITLLLSSFTFYLKINFLYAFVCIAYVQHGFSSIFLCCCSFHGFTFCGFTNSSSYHDQGWLYVLHRKLSTMHLLIWISLLMRVLEHLLVLTWRPLLKHCCSHTIEKGNMVLQLDILRNSMTVVVCQLQPRSMQYLQFLWR